MKRQEDIDREVEATLEIGGSITPVAPPEGLQGRILQRMTGQHNVPVVPFYLRTGFAAAAAAVIVAINVATVIYFARGERTPAGSVTQTDPFADIHATYFPEDTDY